jgi:hypothetical protein
VLHLVDAETGEEVTAGEAVAALDSLKGSVSSLRVADAPGWMTALVVHYEVARPRRLLWLPGNRTHRGDDLPQVMPLTAIPCIRPQGEALTAVIDGTGSIELHGGPAAHTRFVGGTAGVPALDLPPVAVRAPTGDWQLAVAERVPGDDTGHRLELWDLKPSDGTAAGRPLHHSGVPLAHWVPLVHPDQI